MLAPDIVACCYEALKFPDVSQFKCQHSFIPETGANIEIEYYSPVIVPIIGGYKSFIHTASERVCSALAFIVRYDYSSINFSSIEDLPTPHPGHNPHHVLCKYVSKKLLTEYFQNNPHDTQFEIEVTERDYIWPVLHNWSGYPPSSSTSNIVSPLHYFVFLALHCTELSSPSENAYSFSLFQQNLTSTGVVVGTILVSPLQK